MKMTKDHYDELKRHVGWFFNPDNYSYYQEKGFSDMRFCWDAIQASDLDFWVCHYLYPYLNDNHIDTALRKIMKENLG